MLKPAQLYREELNYLYINTWYDKKYMYYYSSPDREELVIDGDSTNCSRDFACVDEDGNITGYFSYYLDWRTRSVCGVGLISFKDKNYELIKDVMRHIDWLFNEQKIIRIEWYCYADNPARDGYYKLIKRYGGEQVGYLRNNALLADGQLHDSVIFELLRINYTKLKF